MVPVWHMQTIKSAAYTKQKVKGTKMQGQFLRMQHGGLGQDQLIAVRLECKVNFKP